MQAGLRLRLLRDLRHQVAQVDRGPIAVRLHQVVHLRVQVVRRQVERDGAIVHLRQPMHQLHILRLQVEQRIHHRLVRLRGLARYGLVGLALLVDDQVHLRLFHPQQIQPDVRGHSAPRDMGQETENLDAHKDLVRGQVRRLARTFEAVHHQPVHFHRQVPEVEVHPADLDPAADRIFERRDQLLAHPPLKVRRTRVVGCAEKQDHQQQRKPAKEPRERERQLAAKGAPAPRPAALVQARRRLRCRCASAGICLFAHCATSSGFMMRTDPCAFNERSQSSSSAVTRFCSSTTWIWSEIVSSFGGATFFLANSGMSVLV